MSRVAHFCLCLALSVAGGVGVAHAYDQRVDPSAARRAEIGITFDMAPMRTLSDRAGGKISSDAPRLPREYAPAMTWYRVALSEGYPQPPIVAAQWSYDEQLPEPLHWAWMAGNGDLVTRVGKGIFQLSTAN